MYAAKIIKVTNLQLHPNANNLKLLFFGGMQFVVGLDCNVGDTVILFPVDGKLSHEMLYHNNLYRDASKNLDTLKSGFFEDNGKIRAQKFRGEMSQGFVIGIRGVEWATNKLDKLEVGLEFDTIDGHVICEKYYTPATRVQMQKTGNKTRKSNNIERWIHKHYDTEQLAYNLDKLPESGLVIVTEKAHGSSGFTGYIKTETKLFSGYANIINNLFKRQFIKPKIKTAYEYVTCTRNTVCNDREDCTSIEGAEYYRWQYHNKFIGILRKGETIYYELVGFTHTGKPIMNQQSTEKLQDKSITKKYGKIITYSYNCDPVVKQNDIYVYRITMQNDSGDVIELPWFQVEQRCNKLGLKTVPVLEIMYVTGAMSDYAKYVTETFLYNGSSIIDITHLREGFCFRIESEDGTKVYKQKNQIFLVLEGVAKEVDSYVDTEEIN